MLLRRIIRRFHARIRLAVSRKFLKKYHCSSWREYHRRFDPGINYRVSLVRDYFQGYKYIHCFESYDHWVYRYDRQGLNSGAFKAGYQDIDDWCYQNCQSRYNYQALRVIRNQCGEWECNEIGGGDYFFFAFASEQDYFMFILRWS